MNIQKISSYRLIVELLTDGRLSIEDGRSPISSARIITELSSRCDNCSPGKVDGYIQWFLSSESDGSDEEKENIRLIMKILEVEREALRKMGRLDDSL